MSENLYERLANLRRLDQEKLVQQAIAQEMQMIEVDDLTGLCKYFAYNIKDDLQQVGVNAKLLDLKQYSEVDHLALIVERAEDGILIDPSYRQFCAKDGWQMIDGGQFFDQKLHNPALAEQLNSQGYVVVSSDDLDDYINSFK